MAAPNPYAGITAQTFDPATDWKEDAANYSPNGPAMFGPNGGEVALVGKVEALRAVACLRCFLGYSNITPYIGGTPAGPPFFLQRTPPVWHPDYPRLVCTS